MPALNHLHLSRSGVADILRLIFSLARHALSPPPPFSVPVHHRPRFILSPIAQRHIVTPVFFSILMPLLPEAIRALKAAHRDVMLACSATGL